MLDSIRSPVFKGSNCMHYGPSFENGSYTVGPWSSKVKTIPNSHKNQLQGPTTECTGAELSIALSLRQLLPAMLGGPQSLALFELLLSIP